MLDWIEETRKHLTKLRLSPERKAEIVEELAQHLADRYEEILSLGSSEEEAARLVLVEFGKDDLLVRELQVILEN